ncbi:MAG: tripartite tricarboxylate transporter substrate binding protein [Proteobacteria bacterium]|nr:tripartite tricarboxylate transporter substrate binding protein [Burkholderiales bacterium]
MKVSTNARVHGAMLSAALCASSTALAQAYPVKPIQMIVPVQAGSGADAILRIVAQRMSDNMKQTILLENMPGAAGMIGAERAARAPADGYTVFGSNDGTLNMTPHLQRKVAYDTLESFEPVSLLANITWVLIATPSLPVKSVKDLIALAKSKPGQLDYASGGIGSPQHIAMELFSTQAGVKLNHVPFKGATQAATDVVSGHVPTMFTALSIVLSQIQAGKVRAIAVGGAKRFPQIPNVPTVSESGLPGYDFVTWAGLYVPRGTPKAVIDRLHAEAQKAVADGDVRDKLLALGLEPVGSTPEELRRITREGFERMGKTIRAAGIKPE